MSSNPIIQKTATTGHEKLKTLMLRKGYSQSKIAELTGVSQKAVSNWVAGKFGPKPSTILKLSELLEVPVDVLTTEKEIPEPFISEHISIGMVLAELQKQNTIMQELLVVLTQNTKLTESLKGISEFLNSKWLKNDKRRTK